MGPEQISGGQSEGLPERAVWRRACDADAPNNDEARFLDLAAYADGLLDEDEQERVQVLVARDATSAEDIAVARTLASASEALHHAVPAAVIERAQALQNGPIAPQSAQIIPFRAVRRARIGWQAAANWASLAAALLVASWLGFTLGIDTSRDLGQIGQSSDDSVLLRELFDPTTGLLRDVTEGLQT